METVCENILDYKVHAEREGSLRYSKGESQTMGTLKGLRNRGVKVELGIPDDLWDTPSAEITQLKKYVRKKIFFLFCTCLKLLYVISVTATLSFTKKTSKNGTRTSETM